MAQTGFMEPRARRRRLEHAPVEWYTPTWVIQSVLSVLQWIDLDPCANSRLTPSIPAREHFTREEDGLSREWHGRVYLNPPFGQQIAPWIEKACVEHAAGRMTQGILLVPASVSCRWFAPLWEHLLCFYQGRIQFIDGTTGSPAPGGLPTPIVFCYLGHSPDRFAREFSRHGPIARAWRVP